MRFTNPLLILLISELATLPATAQYTSNVNPLGPSFPLPVENTLNFTSTNPQQSYTCQYGGGTRAMIYAGAFSGVEKNNSDSLTNSSTTGDNTTSTQVNPSSYPGALGLGAGFIIPLKSKNEKNMSQACGKILTLVQSQELLSLLDQFKKAGTLSQKDYLLRVGQVQDELLGTFQSKPNQNAATMH